MIQWLRSLLLKKFMIFYVINILGHPRIEPRHFVDQSIVESYSKKYMFLGCIEFISKVQKDIMSL